MIAGIKNGVSVILVAMIFQSQAASKLSFIDPKFDDFMKRVEIPEQDRQAFKQYYAQIFSKIQESDAQKKRSAQGYLYKLALDSLEKKHNDWFTALKPFVSDPRITLDTDLNDVRMFIGGFLLRYGAYQEFCSTNKKTDSVEENGIWHSIKSYAHSARETVVGWLGLTQDTTVA